MNKERDFEKVYSKIISEGFFRGVKQMFQSEAKRQAQLNETLDKLFIGNGFTKNGDSSYQNDDGSVIIMLGKSFKDPAVKEGRVKLIVKNNKKALIKQSDTVNEICSKINKLLSKAGSPVQLQGERAIDKAAAAAEEEDATAVDFNE